LPNRPPKDCATLPAAKVPRLELSRQAGVVEAVEGPVQELKQVVPDYWPACKLVGQEPENLDCLAANSPDEGLSIFLDLGQV
jgi:hypothetical protein